MEFRFVAVWFFLLPLFFFCTISSLQNIICDSKVLQALPPRISSSSQLFSLFCYSNCCSLFCYFLPSIFINFYFYFILFLLFQILLHVAISLPLFFLPKVMSLFFVGRWNWTLFVSLPITPTVKTPNLRLLFTSKIALKGEGDNFLNFFFSKITCDINLREGQVTRGLNSEFIRYLGSHRPKKVS